MTPRRRLALGIGCAVTVLLIWASFILIARASAARNLAPLDIAWLRFVFSGLAVLPLAAWRWRSFVAGLGSTPRQALARGVALTLSGGVVYSFVVYAGFFYAPAAHAAVLMPGSLPLWTALLAVLLLGERLTPLRCAGLGLIVVGDVLVGGASLLEAFRGGSAWKGDLLFMCSASLWALYGVLCRRFGTSPLDATLAVGLGGLVVVPLYPLVLAAGWLDSGLARAPRSEIVFQAVFQGGLSMLVAGYAFTQVIQIFGPLRTTMITALVPGLAALAAIPLLGEPLSSTALAGLVCVTAGLLLGLRAGAPKPAALAEPGLAPGTPAASRQSTP